jgi:hypothetical protein
MRSLEEGQHVLSASRGPLREKPVIGIRERAAATQGDKPGVTASLVYERLVHQMLPLIRERRGQLDVTVSV